ncbi:hypothetical protein [Mollivirus kamchatka]|nr:hypothetical protein [Mollivirus kamchatka]
MHSLRQPRDGSFEELSDRADKGLLAETMDPRSLAMLLEQQSRICDASYGGVSLEDAVLAMPDSPPKPKTRITKPKVRGHSQRRRQRCRPPRVDWTSSVAIEDPTNCRSSVLHHESDEPDDDRSRNRSSRRYGDEGGGGDDDDDDGKVDQAPARPQRLTVVKHKYVGSMGRKRRLNNNNNTGAAMVLPKRSDGGGTGNFVAPRGVSERTATTSISASVPGAPYMAFVDDVEQWTSECLCAGASWLANYARAIVDTAMHASLGEAGQIHGGVLSSEKAWREHSSEMASNRTSDEMAIKTASTKLAMAVRSVTICECTQGTDFVVDEALMQAASARDSHRHDMDAVVDRHAGARGRRQASRSSLLRDPSDGDIIGRWSNTLKTMIDKRTTYHEYALECTDAMLETMRRAVVDAAASIDRHRHEALDVCMDMPPTVRSLLDMLILDPLGEQEDDHTLSPSEAAKVVVLCDEALRCIDGAHATMDGALRRTLMNCENEVRVAALSTRRKVQDMAMCVANEEDMGKTWLLGLQKAAAIEGNGVLASAIDDSLTLYEAWAASMDLVLANSRAALCSREAVSCWTFVWDRTCALDAIDQAPSTSHDNYRGDSDADQMLVEPL